MNKLKDSGHFHKHFSEKKVTDFPSPLISFIKKFLKTGGCTKPAVHEEKPARPGRGR
jgi:hypothetical protein